MLNVKTSVVAVLSAIMCTGLALAQGAPPASGAPGAGGPAGAGMGAGGAMQQAADTAEEAAAKKVLQEFGKLVDGGKVKEAFEQYVSKDVVDHSNMPRRMLNVQKVGYNEMEGMFEKFIGPRQGNFVDQIYANEGMVTVKGKVGRDIFLVKNGKITDHWDTMQEGTQSAAGAPAGGPPAGGAK